MSERIKICFEIYRKRALFIQCVREYFLANGYLEVETPVISPFLLPEPSIEVFRTDYIDPDERRFPCYLIPSPELWMKRLVAAGSGNIFQITKCFRNIESVGIQHNPEFSMCEWYTVNADYLDSMVCIEALLAYINKRLPEIPSGILDVPPRRMSVKEAFERFCNMDLDSFIGTDIEGKREAAGRTGIILSEDDTEEQLFNKLFLTFVEPNLPAASPLILYDYPHCVPVFAKKKAGTRYYERWELYMGGMEIANCFSEETDMKRIRSFIRSETERKKKCRILHAVDVDLPAHFRKDVPPFSGVALGLDRLFMVLFNRNSIGDVMFFPFSQFNEINRMEEEEE
ncbi:MAG: elongation factor P--(R)-beta-lysine ligase [Spirochaetales bacterium]|nr:elongation factor P--(R)-beta-lysine ligase [Spirochaetales bacterium]